MMRSAFSFSRLSVFSYVLSACSAMHVWCQPCVFPELISYRNIDGGAVDVVVDGEVAYTLSSVGGMSVLDIADPGESVVVGSVGDQVSGSRMAKYGDYIYIAGWTSIEVIDVSNPSAPLHIASVSDMGSSPNDIFVYNGYAYVQDRFNGLVVYDMADPQEPVQVAVRSIGGNSTGRVYCDGNRVYATDGLFGGVAVFDITTPDNPVLLSQYHAGTHPADIAVRNGVAFIADGYGIEVVDLSSPAMPSVLGRVATPGSSRAIELVDDTIYVADTGAGLQVISISEPDNPILVGGLDTQGSATGIFVDASRETAFLAAGLLQSFQRISIGVHGCMSDVNCDGVVNPADFSAWVTSFNNNERGCDQNSDRVCTAADFSAWVANFNRGC